MYPEIFKIGPFTLHSFGLMAMLGFLIPTLIMRKEFRYRQIDPDLASTISVAAIIGGFIGARLYFIIEHWHAFLREPMSMIFSGAGLVWYGGLFGGVIAVIWVIRHYKMPFWQTADIVAVLVLLGQTFGRMGCLLAADGDYGPPSDVPWAMRFPDGVRSTLNNPELQEAYRQMHPGQPVPDDIAVHPTPLYDILWLLSAFAFLWSLRRRDFVPGTLFGGYFIAVGIGRFITEFWRMTPKVAFGWMTLAQIISVSMIALGVFIIYQRRRAHDEPPVVRATGAVSKV